MEPDKELSRSLILKRIKQVDDLPVFPEIVQRLENELSKENSSLATIAEIVNEDVSLSAQILKVANSAFYASTAKATNTLQAIVRLGVKEVRKLAFTTAVLTQFGRLGGADPRRFWLHSISVALTTRVVAARASTTATDEELDLAYTAGLLHDLGALLLSHLFPEECAAVAEHIRAVGGSTWEIELERWGIEHGEAGAILAHQWKLPSVIGHVIRHHHKPWEVSPEHRRPVQLTHLANFVCNNQGFARVEEGFPDEFDHGSWQALGLTLEDVPELIAEVREQGRRSEVFMSLAK